MGFLIGIFDVQIWEGYVEGQEATNGAVSESKQKEVIKVRCLLFV